MSYSPAFLDLIGQPNAVRVYLVTVSPFAIVTGMMASQASGNRLLAGVGTFSALLPGDALNLSRPSLADAPITITEVAEDGASVTISGVTLADAAAAACMLAGLVTRYFSTGGYNSSPTDTPANVHYEDGVENALRFTRNLFAGDRIGGRSVPGFGDIVLANQEGRYDAYRFWGWAGRSVTVELGALDFARNEFGLIFQGITAGITLSDSSCAIAVRDLTGLLSQPLYQPAYRGTGGAEGGLDQQGTPKPICIGRCRNVAPVPLGIVNGRYAFQFHDGAVHGYEAAWHVVRDQGVPLTYVGSAPAAGQWTLDAARGLIILGGDQPALLTADVIGTDQVPADASAGRAMEYLVRQRLMLDNGDSASSLTVGAGVKSLTLSTILPLGVGGQVLVAASDDPDQIWMRGTITGWAAGALSINVTEFAGTGTYAQWTVTKIGMLATDIAPGAGGDAFDVLHALNPAPVQVYLTDAAPALDVLDSIINSIGGFYGCDRAGLFDAGLVTAPAATAVLEIDGATVLDGLQRQDTLPPVWRVAIGYGRNHRPATNAELAESVRRNAVTNGVFAADSGWTKGTGWSIAGGMASAAAGAGSILSQGLTLTVGQTYRLTASVTRSAGALQWRVGGVDVGAAMTSSGVIMVEFTATSASPDLAAVKDAAFVGAIDDVAVTTADLAFFTSEYRYPVAAANARTRTLYGPQARSLRLDSLLRDASDAVAEQARQLSLHGQVRDIFLVPTKTEPFQVDIGDTVRLTDARYGLAAGQNFIVIGIDEDAGDNRVTLTLWG